MSINSYLSKLPSLVGKTYIVTGANSGIGLQTAKHLASLGAKVILACRSKEKASAAMEYIRTAVPSAELEFAAYDQASYASIDEFVSKMKVRRLDGIVLNAGICGSLADKKTADGLPLILGTNFYGPMHLVEQWKDKLKADKTRVVFVSSLAARLSRWQPLDTFVGGSANRQYGFSKLCLSAYACKCMREYELEAVLVHPGVSGTSILFGQDSSLPKFVVKWGSKFLGKFPNKGAGPALMSVVGICTAYRKNLYIRPGLPLGLFGRPRVVKMPGRFMRDLFG